MLQERGVRVMAYEPAGGIVRAGSRWRVSGREADAVVIAAGAWSGELTVDGVALPATVPVKGFLLGYAMKPGTLQQIRRSGHTYVLQRRDGFTIAGSTEQHVGFEEAVDQALVRS